MQLDDTYYLKALDNYPYNLEDALEALHYGLSVNPEHPGLLTLQGKMFANELQSPEQAVESFSAAIGYAPEYRPAYYQLGLLLLNNKSIKQAEKVIALAFDRFGNHCEFLYLNAYLAEIEGRYDAAIDLLETAKLRCYNSSDFEHYGDKIRRIRQKCRRPLSAGGYKIYYEVK